MRASLFLAAAALILVGCSSPTTSTAPASTTNTPTSIPTTATPSSPTTTEAPATTSSPAKSSNAWGSTVAIGSYKVTATEPTRAPVWSPNRAGIVAYAFSVTLENTGAQPLEFNLTQFHLQDDAGQSYGDPTEFGQSQLSGAKTLQPGAPLVYIIGFEIPGTAKPMNLTFVPETSAPTVGVLWGSQ